MQLKMELAPQQLAMDAETEHLEHTESEGAETAEDTDGGALQYETGDAKDGAKDDTKDDTKGGVKSDPPEENLDRSEDDDSLKPFAP